MKILIVFLFTLLSLSCLADMQGTLVFQEKTLNKGQTVSSLLMIERSNLSFILQEDDLVLKKISPALVIIKPNWIKVSENNADIIEASVLISILGDIKSWDPITLPLLQENINFVVKNNPKIEGLKSEPIKEFQFLPFSLSIPMNPLLKKILIILGIIILLIGFILIFNFMKKKKHLKKIQEERRKNFEAWKAKFENAKVRKDYELLLKEQNHWNHFVLDSAIVKGFSEKVAQYQYQEDWGDDVYREVQLHHQRVLKVLRESQNGI